MQHTTDGGLVSETGLTEHVIAKGAIALPNVMYADNDSVNLITILIACNFLFMVSE